MRLISLSNPPSFLDDFFDLGPTAVRSFVPAVEVKESDNDIVVRAELPGVDPKAVEVTVLGDVLTLAGEKTGGIERQAGGFERQIQLPFETDSSKTVAHAEFGVLTITLEKRTEDKARRISVEVK